MPIDHTKNWWLVYYEFNFDQVMSVFRITGPHSFDDAIATENSYDGIGFVTAHHQEEIKNDEY